MKLIMKLTICLLFFGSIAYAADKIPYLDNRLSSKWWQIRYCLINELNDRNDPGQNIIKKLMADTNETVSLYAHRIYMLNYLFIDKNLIIKKIDKLNPLPEGDLRTKKSLDEYYQSIKSVEHYAALLKNADINDPNIAPAIAFIGILGKPEETSIIEPCMESQNDYVLLETAKAFLRMGENKKGIIIIEKILAKKIKDHIHYQTEALYILRLVNTKKFEKEYLKIRQTTENDSDIEQIQPNWLNAHYIQGIEINTEKLSNH